MFHDIDMKVAVYNKEGEKIKDITLSDSFEKASSKEAVTLYVNYLRNSMRGAIANSKDRSEVSGGGKKPWKQKGTGRARAGSSRSPLWPGGGVTFGPTNERNFKIKINKELKKSVIASVIGSLFKDEKAKVMENVAFEAPKTKSALSLLDKIKVEGKLTLVYTESDKNADKSFRNIAGIRMMRPNRLNLIDIMSSDNLIISEDAIKKVQELYAR